MAIYKLGEICESITISKKPKFPQYIINTSDVFLNNFTPRLMSSSIKGQFKKTVRPGEIIFSEIRPTNGRWGLIEEKNNWLLSTKLIVIKCRKNILSKYLYVILTGKVNNKIGEIARSRSGSFPQITFKSISNIKVNIPTIKTQQQIIDIIEPMENLLNKTNKAKNIVNKMVKELPIKITKKSNIFSSIKTGNKNVNASSLDGIYPFYTCGNKVLKTKTYSFDGRYILLSGNGEIYNWWIDGKFDLYQRVYALKEKENFFTTYFSLIKGIEKLRKRANGAVIKFIKLQDIKSIEAYDPKYEKLLENFFNFEDKLAKISHRIKELINSLIKLLIK